VLDFGGTPKTDPSGGSDEHDDPDLADVGVESRAKGLGVRAKDGVR
jgi:hypothetical protein